jgi:formylglycine-generating enzyme required for sulfatase activity
MKKMFVLCISLMVLVVYGGCESDNENSGSETTSKGKADNVKVITNSIGMKLVWIPPGEFMMGSRDSASEVDQKTSSKHSHVAWLTDEFHQHRVRISKGFWMGVHEVTQGQYQAVMGCNPSRIKGDNNPVEWIRWHDAVEFCKKLSDKEGRTYRLPTEAEWEYACRAGTTTPFYTGETISTDQVNYGGDDAYSSGREGVARQKTVPVGSFPSNAFGLYDMHGNVFELCADRYGEDYYVSSPSMDPPGPSSGTAHVMRGGSWGSNPRCCRSAYRVSYPPASKSIGVGFRVVSLDFQ